MGDARLNWKAKLRGIVERRCNEQGIARLGFPWSGRELCEGEDGCAVTAAQLLVKMTDHEELQSQM